MLVAEFGAELKAKAREAAEQAAEQARKAAELAAEQAAWESEEMGSAFHQSLLSPLCTVEANPDEVAARRQAKLEQDEACRKATQAQEAASTAG